MLGFGKKKNTKVDNEKTTSQDGSKKNLPPDEPAKDKTSKDKANKYPLDKSDPNKSNLDKNNPEKTSSAQKTKTRKKKRIPVKWILIVFFILCVGAGAFVVYSLYFSSNSDLNQTAAYKDITLVHIHLPEEMLKFSFNHFPELYALIITANTEINIIEDEIERIDAVLKKYPDQAMIAEKEKKTWEKTRDTLQKAFIKIEKTVKETYVLFQVNAPDGLARIEALKSALTQDAKTALVPIQEQTKRLKSNEDMPQGFIQGTLYQLKKKFL